MIMPDDQLIKEAYEKGYAAYEADQTKDTNPYEWTGSKLAKPADILRTFWLCGFQDASINNNSKGNDNG